jgi:DNA-binding beta-propeller fold protein YncE
MTVLVAEERVSLERETSTEPVCTDRSFAFPGRPAGLAVVCDGTFFVSDATSRTIWRIDDKGGRAVFTRPSGGVPDATCAEMRVLRPAGLAMASDGTLFVADPSGHRIWTVAPGGELHLLAGSANGYRDGPSGDALFRRPCDVAVGPDGACYVADTGNHCIRMIAPDGAVTTLAGSIYDYGEGRGPHGRFRAPLALDVARDGTCYVADTGNNAIRRITPDGEVTTLAGAPPGGDRDGPGADVGLRSPTGLALGPNGDLWVADQGNGALRRIDPSGTSTTALRFSGRRFPVAVASAPRDTVVVAAVLLDDLRFPQVCLISVGAGR